MLLLVTYLIAKEKVKLLLATLVSGGKKQTNKQTVSTFLFDVNSFSFLEFNPLDCVSNLKKFQPIKLITQ